VALQQDRYLFVISLDQRFKMNGQAELNKHYACYAFFMPLQPIVALFSPIGLGLIYGVNKYKLFFRFDRPRFHSFAVNDLVDWILAFAPVVFALGQLYAIVWIPSIVSDAPKTLAWIALGIAGFIYIFPKRCLTCCIEE
jgi:hypothetical protein